MIFKEKNISLPEGSSWHKDLIDRAVAKGIISESTKAEVGEYLAFRHFFSHAYALDLYAERMETLVENIQIVYSNFQKDIENFLNE